MKIIHFEVSPEDQSLRVSTGNQVETVESILNADTVQQAQDAEVVTVFVGSVLDKTLIDQMPNLKLIVTRSTGFDHIDIAHAASKGITVCNVPGYGSRTVAEFAFALILTLSRKVYKAVTRIPLHNDWNIADLEGFNLQGKTLGVIGTGRIGQNVIQIAKGFDMNVIANDAFPNEAKATELGFKYADLNEVLKNSDVITIHVPATPETRHLINMGNVKEIKRGAILINTARGDVVDPAALIFALDEGIVGAAGLDVIEGEHELKDEANITIKNSSDLSKLKTLLQDHVLIDYPNVIVTPHIAFDTKEARQEISNITLENITKFSAGQPQNIVKA